MRQDIQRAFSKEEIDRMAEAANGDVRAAINSLQMAGLAPKAAR
jgi:DNA polymerase III delta prime subunit